MKILIFADPHINEKSIPELTKVFEELCTYKADIFICLGDFYDKKHPTTQEILFGTTWADQFINIFKKVVFIKGNHEKTKELSAIDYLEYLGIRAVDNYIDKDNNFYAHFMTDKSTLEYGTAYKTVKELSKYNKVFLGHQHLYQEVKKNKIYHPGSIRFVNFNESKEKYKRIVLLENNKVTFIKLKSPYQMIDISSVKELSNIKSGKKKVRLIINSFDQFKKEVGEFDKYRHKLHTLKIKLNFKETSQSTFHPAIKGNSPINKLQDILIKGIDKLKDKEVKNILKGVLNELQD